MSRLISRFSVMLVGAGIVFIISVWQIWINAPQPIIANVNSNESVLSHSDANLSIPLSKPTSYPFKNKQSSPNISSKATFVFDIASNIDLYTFRENEPLPIASLMKMLTALVAVQEYDLLQEVIVPQSVYEIDGSRIHLVAGDTLSIKELLAGALIPSGNDSAHTIAAVYESGYNAYIHKMNMYAKDQGLKHTNVNNAVGYDFNGQYSSAKDVAILAKLLLKSEVLSEIVKTKSTSIQGTLKTYMLLNTNKLLFTDDRVTGLKTGTSESAGENLVFSWNIKDRTIVGVLLGSSQRFVDAESIIQWVDDAFVW